VAERARLAAANPMHRFRYHTHALFRRRGACNVQHASVILPREKRLAEGKRGFAVVVAVLTEWSSLIVRWLHVVAGIAWIGSSFYFIHLDLSLKSPPGLPPPVPAAPWRLLRPDGQVARRPRPVAGCAPLVQVGSLSHLALRLRAAGDLLLSRRGTLSHQYIRARAARAARRGGRVRKPRPRLAHLR